MPKKGKPKPHQQYRQKLKPVKSYSVDPKSLRPGYSWADRVAWLDRPRPICKDN